jgi:hypothetical protein
MRMVYSVMKHTGFQRRHLLPECHKVPQVGVNTR